MPDHHPSFALAAERGVGVRSEFDLARAWDDRPVVAITGTNGKTTVTMMVTDALEAGSVRAEAVGNTEVPLVRAIDDPTTEVFVVEASSFRLAHSACFRPRVATWLNFAPDHLDAHASLAAYEAAKASIWAGIGGGEQGAVAVANADDEVVMAHARPLIDRSATVHTFSIAGPADWCVRDGDLVGPDGPFAAVSDLKRRQPHDLANALAVAATATAAGGPLAGVVTAVTSFDGLAHRLEFLGSRDGIDWYNDSKATVPHATVAAVGGFGSVVLIAGGKNKGLSLDPLRETVPPVRAVVAVGDAGPEVSAVYDGLVPVEPASSMVDAIRAARSLAEAGDAVLLSPACTSFDWYPNYVERGLDFSALVRSEVLAS